MKQSVRPLFSAALLFFMIAAPLFSLSPAEEAFQDGLEAFRNSRFSLAERHFQEILKATDDEDLEASAHFWIAKTTMAKHQLEEAERHLEHFLQHYPRHAMAAEARYQQGRLLFLQDHFDEAIQALGRFMDRHPDSPFVANAVYWTGEALFNLGRLDEARRIFQTVLRDHPRSFRVEAARYRIAVIELTFREHELLELLRWSHEEYLRAVDEFQRQESAYRDALASYRRRLQNAADADLQEELLRLNTDIQVLQETLRSRDARIRRLEEQLTTLRSETARPR
ncbi:Tetratricopeptide repeat-containing protein [Alkalispirochaeta americana]|uniref:Tetratricopeptide repeat-containing protein n=1 Tax=Alkalispirochaeta americana TaxID=159291 RepID=A0A1N6P7I4_9SPIO|nr:tetratricopeptide repeat protein [Alkalispirochaeta americana]SIQ00285.1 Tetratricopeptide repeat-containing protein [Alkalispirochaeta americana]